MYGSKNKVFPSTAVGRNAMEHIAKNEKYFIFVICPAF
jgi:hypothetical protein